MYWSAPVVTTIVTIGVYQYIHKVLDINRIMVGLYVFNLLQDPLRDLPYIITSIIDTLVSMKRLENFIRESEVNSENLIKEESNEIAIKIDNISFTWGKPNEEKEEEKEKKDDKKVNKKTKVNPIDKNISTKDTKINSENESFINDTNKSNLDQSEITNNKTFDNINGINDKSIIIINEEKEKINSNNENKDTINIKGNETKSFVTPVLKNINIEIKKGEFVGIFGEVGSGKSSLIQSIMNNLLIFENLKANEIEINKENTNDKVEDNKKIAINGSLSYTAQSPWIQNETIENNIIFFSPFDEKRYKEVIKVSQLEADLEILPGKDKTEIGEKGINLSGGQKARVSLARSIYAQKDIYLFDDPISALDADVGKKVFNECFMRYLSEKTRILVTHNIQYLRNFDRILWLSEGEIAYNGNFEGLENEKIYKEFTKDLKNLVISKKNENERKKSIDDVIEEIDEKEKIQEIHRITSDEDQEVGDVKAKIFIKYFDYMGGNCLLVSIFLIMFLWQGLKGFSDIYLAEWTKITDQTQEEKWISFAIYAGFALSSCILIYLRVFILGQGTLRLAHLLHKDMIYSLIKAPINLFHDSNPKGRILNRLSKDLENMDYCMFTVGSLLVALFSVIGAIVICALYMIYTLAAIPVLFILGAIFYRYYVKTSKDLQRLEGVTRSPVLNIVSEVISGAMSVRTFGMEEAYKIKFNNAQDTNIKVNIFMNGCYSWFGLVMDLLANLFLIALISLVVVFRESFDPQAIGLIITYSLRLQTEIFNFFIRISTFENSMVSMERCNKFTEIPQEKADDGENDKNLISLNQDDYSKNSKFIKEENLDINKNEENCEKKNWPSEGKIEFSEYSVQYRPDTPIVLDKLSFVINSNEKIGIVGRTGSGKVNLFL